MTDDATKLVSVIIPSYNHAPYVGAAIKSVQAQTHRNLEILIQDDCSSDQTLEIIEGFARKDSRIKVSSTAQNIGGAANHTDLLSQTQGEFIALLSSDDVWVPHKTTLQLDLLRAHPECVAVFGQPSFIDHAGRDQEIAKSPFSLPIGQPAQLLRHLFDHGNILCHPASMIRREPFQAIADLEMAAVFASLPDLYFWIGLGGHGDLLMHDDTVTQFRLHSDGTNTSHGSIANSIRDRNETPYVLQAFLNYLPDRLCAIFPDQIHAGLSAPSRAIRLAQYAARLRDRAHHAFALAVAFDVMKNPENVAICQSEIDFGLTEFHQFTRWCDGQGTGRDYLQDVAQSQWRGKTHRDIPSEKTD